MRLKMPVSNNQFCISFIKPVLCMCIHMLTEEQLKWTPKDDEIVEKHRELVAAGKVKTVNFLQLKRE
jgi:hypothetical protein